MKKLFAILFLIALTSCGSSLQPALETPKNNNDYKNIIGNPVKIEKLEVAQYDFPKEMNWEDAKKACEALGQGWKLPSKDELDFLYQNRDAIGRFTSRYYWSSTVTKNGDAWKQSFNSGKQYYVFIKNGKGVYNVRAVRAF